MNAEFVQTCLVLALVKEGGLRVNIMQITQCHTVENVVNSGDVGRIQITHRMKCNKRSVPFHSHNLMH